MMYDEAFEIAKEHIAWCKANGVAAIDVARTVGGVKPKDLVSWDAATWIVAAAWNELGRAEAA